MDAHFLKSSLLIAVFWEVSKAGISIDLSCPTDFIKGYKALLFEMPADNGVGNVETIPR